MEVKILKLSDLFRHETNCLNVPKGETLFKEGECGEEMYVLLSGTVDIFVNHKLVEKAGDGSILGEMGLVGDQPHSATVIATSDCRLAAIGAARFNFLVQQTPNFAIHVMRVMANRIRNIDKLLEAKTAHKK